MNDFSQICKRSGTSCSNNDALNFMVRSAFGKETRNAFVEAVDEIHLLKHTYTLPNKSQAASNFLSPASEVTRRTVAFIMRVVRTFLYLCIPSVSVFHSVHSRRVYIKQRH